MCYNDHQKTKWNQNIDRQTVTENGVPPTMYDERQKYVAIQNNNVNVIDTEF